MNSLKFVIQNHVATLNGWRWLPQCIQIGDENVKLFVNYPSNYGQDSMGRPCLPFWTI
jgi:hypothetical protein